MKKGILLTLIAIALSILSLGATSVSAATTVNVSTVSELQSAHPYSSSMDQTWVYTHPTNSLSLKLTFSSDTKTEEDYDFIYILDGNNNQIGKYSGTELANQTITVPGKVVKIRLTSDSDTQRNGFAVTDIQAITVLSTGKCGANATYKLYSDGLLDIEGSGAIYDYGTSARPEFYTYSSNIKTVNIAEGITKIGKYLFYNVYYGTDTRYAIDTIYIPNSVTEIGNYAFYSCRANDVYLGSGIKTIGTYVFNNPSTFNIHYEGSPAMKEQISFGTSNGTNRATWDYTSDGGSFGSGLTWNYDIKLKKLTISGNGAIPSYSTSTSQGEVAPWHQYKETMEELIIGNGITDIGQFAFYSLPNLKKLTLSDNIEELYWNDYSIANCPNLTYIYLGKKLNSLPTDILSSVSEIEISPDNSTFCVKDNVVFSKDMKKMKYYPKKKTDRTYYVPVETEDVSSCFQNNTYLTAIYLHPYVKVDSQTFLFMDRYLTIYAFKDSPAYTEVDSRVYAYYQTSDYLTTRKLTLYSCGVYASCGDNVTGILSTVSVPEWEEKLPKGKLTISGTGYMENMSTYPWSSYMNNIKEIVVEDGVKSIGNRAFMSCNNLEKIYIGNTVESIGSEALMWSSKLTTLNIPDSVKSIGDFALEYCETLTDITIGKGLETIGRRAFRFNMTPAYTIHVDNPTFKTIDGHIYSKDGTTLVRYAIGNVNSSYAIPDGVTTIGFAAFEGATNLKEVSIPLSVASIKESAFYLTNSSFTTQYTLDGVYYSGSQSQFNKIVIDSSNNSLKNAPKTFDKYDIVFKDIGGVTIKEIIVDSGAVVNNEEIPTKEEYSYKLYTEPDCINEYSLDTAVNSDLALVVKYIPNVLNKLKINEFSEATVGESDVVQYLSFATDKDVNSLYCFIKYPNTLDLKSVVAKDFAYAGLEDEYTEDGFTTAVILAQYSETELIPQNIIHIPFELKFDVSKSATAGTVQIEATEESCLIGNDTYFFEERIAGNLEITAKLAESIDISGDDVISSATVYIATVFPDYCTSEIEWSIDDETIAIVDKNGVVTPITSGTFTLTATAKDDSGVFATKQITVIRGVESIEIVGANSITESTKYSVNIMPDYATNKEVEWTISDSEIATISQDGTVTPITSGLVTITVSAKDGSGTVATKEINIIKLAESIDIVGEENISSPAQYTVIVLPDYTSDKEVVWSVDNNEIATVDELGIVTPVRSGDIILTATAKDGSGSFATKTIKIVKLAESIEIIGEEEITEPSQYSVVILPEYTTNKNAEWSVSDETVAIVDESGLVTPLRNGKIVLTAKAEDASGIETTKSIVITVSVRANSITSDVGAWDKEFDSDITEYTISVPSGTSAIYLTSSFTNATAKVNGSPAVNGVRKKVNLTNNETNIEILLTPTTGNTLKENIYTIKVVRGSFTKTTVSEDGKSFTITPVNIENGKTVILALYEEERFVEMQSVLYEGKAIPFTTKKTYTNAKVMVWDDLITLRPVCDVEIVK